MKIARGNSKLSHWLHLHWRVDLLGDGGHGVVDPVDCHHAAGDAANPLDAGEGAAQENGFHVEGHAIDRHTHAGRELLQSLGEGSQRKDDPVGVQCLSLNDRQDDREAVAIHVADEFEVVQFIEETMNPGIERLRLALFFAQAARKDGFNGGENHVIHWQGLAPALANQIEVVNSVHAKVSIVAEHGQVVIALDFSTLFGFVGVKRFAMPELFVERHDQEAAVGVYEDVFLAKSLGELPPHQFVGRIGADRGDHGQVRLALRGDGSQQPDFEFYVQIANILFGK